MNKKLFTGLFAIVALILTSLACNAGSLLGGGALLEDDFSNSNSGWGIGTDTDSSVEYENSGLQMKIFTSNFFVWSTPDSETYENVHIEVTVNNNGTDATTAFGILCHQQPIDSAFYYFAITPAGEYAIVEASVALADVILTNDDQWATSDAIAQNAASYRVGADCGNGTLALYVDGQQIASVSDSTYTSGGVGLFTWSGEEVDTADVTFDDFVMTKLAK